MILRAETEIGKEGWKTCRVKKKKKLAGLQDTKHRRETSLSWRTWSEGFDSSLLSLTLLFHPRSKLNLSFNCSRSWPTQKLRAVLQPTSQEKNCNIDII